jgi:hypothetical protein
MPKRRRGTARDGKATRLADASMKPVGADEPPRLDGTRRRLEHDVIRTLREGSCFTPFANLHAEGRGA